MEHPSHVPLDQRTRKLKEFHRKVKLTLNDSDRDHLYSSLKKYQAERKLNKLLHSLKTILDTPVKLDLLKEIRGFIPPHQVSRYDEEVPYHNMAHKWKSRSTMSLNRVPNHTARGRPPSHSSHGTPVSRRHAPGGALLTSAQSPLVKMLSVSPFPGERLGFSVRGGSEHGLGIFVSEVEEGSAADRCGLHLGDQLIEVNSISFERIAGSSAVKVLTGSERLKLLVRRVGKIPGSKCTREKVAWYDVHLRRLVRGDPTTHNALDLPGSLASGQERKINLNKPTRSRPHLGFNIRGGAEFGLGAYVSRTDPGGLADENGLRVGEEVLEVNGQRVRDRTHADTVGLIRQQKTLILTVRDVGRYPAFKEIYAEYKWVDVSTGRVTKTRCYKKYALETSGQIQSMSIRSPSEDVYREGFAESHIERLSEGEGSDSDGLEDVLMHLQPHEAPASALRLALQEEKLFAGDYIHQTPPAQRSSLRHGGIGPGSQLTRSLDNIPLQLDTVVPVLSAGARSASQADLSLGEYQPSAFQGGKQGRGSNGWLNGHTSGLHTPSSRRRGPDALWESVESSDEADDTEGERLFYRRPRSAMESAMDFSSLHDLRVAGGGGGGGAEGFSSNTERYPGDMYTTESEGEGSVVPRRRGDVTMRTRTEEEDDSIGRSGGRGRSRDRSNLGVLALQNEARRSHPQLVTAEQKAEPPASGQEVSGKRSGSKTRSLRERLFGSRSKDRDKQEKKKSKRSRKPLSGISFDQSDKENENRDRKLDEISRHAEGVLSADETAAVLRHLSLYGSDGKLAGLTQRLFVLLDSTDKMQLCTHIRAVIKSRDQKAFDTAVNAQFDSLVNEKVKQKHQSHRANGGTQASPHIKSSVSSSHHLAAAPRRIKRKAPPPPSPLTEMRLQPDPHTSPRPLTSPPSGDLTETSPEVSAVSSRSPDTSSANSSLLSSSVSLSPRSQAPPPKRQAPPTPQPPQANQREHEGRMSVKQSLESKAECPPTSPQILTVNHVDSGVLSADEELSITQAPPPPPPPPPPVMFADRAAVSVGADRMSSNSSDSHSTDSGSTMVRAEVHTQRQGSTQVEEGRVEGLSSGQHAETPQSQPSLVLGDANPNFTELANQKLEAFRRRSHHGSRDSLNSGGREVESAKQSVMSELQSHLQRRISQQQSGDDPARSVLSSRSTSSLTGSEMAAGGGLGEAQYVESRTQFPVLTGSQQNITSSTLRSDRGTECSQSESVLQATQSLAFLDALETDSQFELSSISHVVTPRSEMSHLVSPRSDISTSSAATSRFGSYDVNPAADLSLSSSQLSNQSGSLRRTPPRFIAPPPPVEPPPPREEEGSDLPSPSPDLPHAPRSRDPSESESVVSSASHMASLRSYRKLTDRANTATYSGETGTGWTASNGTHGNQEAVVTNGYHQPENHDEIKSSNSPSTPKLLSKQKQDTQTTSWLFRDKSVTIKPKDSSTLGPSGGEKMKQQQPVTLDLSGLEAGEKGDTVMVYLDKSFRTMGLSISGGTDSKVQPEIRVKAVFAGGAAEAEGSLKPGMQLVAIDNTSLVRVTHMRAVVTIKKSFENKSRPLMALEVKP